MSNLERDYREANRELIEGFGRFMESKFWSADVIRQRKVTIGRLAEFLGARSLVETQRADAHAFLASLLRKGLSPSTINKETNGLRSFFKFLRLLDLVSVNPMLMISHRKLPKRLPRVLTIEEVEAIINAAKTRVERAVVELLYATGARVSELCSIKLEDVMFPEQKIFVRKGKGGKDRLVFFGQHAANALREYLKWRPSRAGYLFEAPERGASLYVRYGKYWHVSFYDASGHQHTGISVGSVADLPTEEAAREAWERLAAKIPETSPHKPTTGMPPRPYQSHAIWGMVRRLAHRAGIKGVHPHAFRRAVACHLLSRSRDIRAIQDLLGHSRISTTMLYTELTNQEVDEVYRKAHPHA